MLLLDLDSYGRRDPDVMFPLFYKQVDRELAPKLAVIFRHLVKGGSFPICCRLADVVPAPNESSSCNIINYRSISITPVLLKIFKKIGTENLSLF